MALKTLMKRKELSDSNKALEAVRAKLADLEKREAELKTAIEEAETEEEKAAVEESVEEFEKEKTDAEDEARSLEEKVGEIEKEIEELEARQAVPEKTEEPAEEPKAEERKEIEIMDRRNLFAKMDAQTRTAMFEREDVRSFLGNVREAIKNKRAISGAGLLVPEVFIGMIRENIIEYSKLYAHVNVQQVAGNGREVVMGTIPEAVWTDCCGNLNELDLTFNDAEVACWKVGGYFAVCNANIEDSDVDLASELLTALGQGMGYAIDKAILYGLGTRMPLGVVTRLAQTAEPADYSATARTWVDLHTSNIAKTNATGVQLFQAILNSSAAAKGKYSRGEMVWAMNGKTYNKLKAEGLSVNAAGAIVSGIEDSMPVAGGSVVVLDFVPDYDIVYGYFDLYLLAERAGIQLSSSEHVKFLEDRTVFRGTARYDGLPVIAEGFGAININNQNVTTTVTFAADDANTQASS